LEAVEEMAALADSLLRLVRCRTPERTWLATRLPWRAMALPEELRAAERVVKVWKALNYWSVEVR
jgi:hypothetical protein